MTEWSDCKFVSYISSTLDQEDQLSSQREDLWKLGHEGRIPSLGRPHAFSCVDYERPENGPFGNTDLKFVANRAIEGTPP
jgi:hypothetical protein